MNLSNSHMKMHIYNESSHFFLQNNCAFLLGKPIHAEVVCAKNKNILLLNSVIS